MVCILSYAYKNQSYDACAIFIFFCIYRLIISTNTIGTLVIYFKTDLEFFRFSLDMAYFSYEDHHLYYCLFI